MTSLVDLFFRADSIAIVGASDDPSKIGGRPLRYLEQAGFKGEVYAVNPNRQRIQGMSAYSSVRDLPMVPDLAVIAVPRRQVADELTACAEHGVPALVVFSAGFAEEGDAGAADQAELVRIAQRHGSRILGPNSNGLFVPSSGLYALFSPVIERGLPESGHVSLVTQSAAVGTSLLDLVRGAGIGIRAWAHVGNEADVGLLELASDIVADGSVDTLVLAFESLRHAHELLPALELAQERAVRIVAFQSGFSSRARTAAASHTGALTATSPHLIRDLLTQYGATVTTSFRETVRALEPTVRRPGRASSAPARVAVMTSSGGFGVIAADALDATSAVLPILSPDLQARLQEVAPYCHPANPIDTTAQIINDRGAYGRLGAVVAGSGEVDVLVAFLPHPGLDDSLTQELIALADTHGSECAFVAIGPMDGATSSLLRRSGLVVGAEPMDLPGLLKGSEQIPVISDLIPGPTPPTWEDTWSASAVDGLVSELVAKRALHGLGIDVVHDVEVRTPEEAALAWREEWGPVAVKLHAPGVAHKAALGGVRLGVEGAEGVARATREVLAVVPASTGENEATVLLEPMIDGIEAFLGVSDHADFGALAVVGLGGVDVEATSTVAYARLPVSEREVARMMQGSGLTAVLGTVRAPQVAHQIASALEALTPLVSASTRVASVDINPLMVTPSGACVAVDALIEVRQLPDEQRQVG